jgi:outer membrane receptor protein involved in Fe transport
VRTSTSAFCRASPPGATRIGRARPTSPTSRVDSIAVYGSSSAENAYLIDSVNTTNVEYGLEGKEPNLEFIQEIEVKTGGYEAEYGRSTGGIVNVITKSGGNEFPGDLFGCFNDESLQADNEHV